MIHICLLTVVAVPYKGVNVLFITVDCFRADYAGWLNPAMKALTPNMNRLARESVVFKNAISIGSSTPASFPALMTSTYPLMYTDYPRMSSLRTTMASVMKNKGYSTAAFHSNPYVSEMYGYNRGFDTFIDHMGVSSGGAEKKSIVHKLIKNKKLLKRLYVIKEDVKGLFVMPEPPYVRSEVINNEFLSFLEKQDKEPFFAWLHYMDIHHPFMPPMDYYRYSGRTIARMEKIYRGETAPRTKDIALFKSMYSASLRYVDHELGKLFEKLKSVGIWDNTLIILTADHGEEFMDHGDISHKARLYDELIRVPLLIKLPHTSVNTTVDEVVGTINIAPTVADYAGIGDVPGFVGKSMKPLIEGEEWSIRGVISETLTNGGKVSLSFEKGKRIISYRTAEYKYIYNHETQTHEAYDLVEDPQEKVNVYHKEPDMFREYREAVKAHIEFEERTKLSVDMRKIKKLRRALGGAGK